MRLIQVSKDNIKYDEYNFDLFKPCDTIRVYRQHVGCYHETYGDFFSAKKMSPYKVHKKIADQPCYNVIFYMRRTEHKY